MTTALGHSTSRDPYIRMETRFIPPSDTTLPAIAMQVTRMVESYMLWVGTTDEPAEDVQSTALQGHLAKDWACAMPARNLSTEASPAGTSLYRSSSSDAALSMAQRLAKRFNKQIFLSIDIPVEFDTMGQRTKLILAVERAVVETLKDQEQQTHV